MNKKIFKALGAGLKVFVKEHWKILSFFILITVLSVLSSKVMRILGIMPSAGSDIFMAFAVTMGSAWIIGLITHCIDAIKYSEEHECDMEEAWNETGIDFGSDDYF